MVTGENHRQILASILFEGVAVKLITVGLQGDHTLDDQVNPTPAQRNLACHGIPQRSESHSSQRLREAFTERICCAEHATATRRETVESTLEVAAFDAPRVQSPIDRGDRALKRLIERDPDQRVRDAYA
jgi:hypothetical protein